MSHFLLQWLERTAALVEPHRVALSAIGGLFCLWIAVRRLRARRRRRLAGVVQHQVPADLSSFLSETTNRYTNRTHRHESFADQPLQLPSFGHEQTRQIDLCDILWIWDIEDDLVTRQRGKSPPPESRVRTDHRWGRPPIRPTYPADLPDVRDVLAASMRQRPVASEEIWDLETLDDRPRSEEFDFDPPTLVEDEQIFEIDTSIFPAELAGILSEKSRTKRVRRCRRANQRHMALPESALY